MADARERVLEQDSEQEQSQSEQPAVQPAGGTMASALLGLSMSAGNQAVVQLLRQQGMLRPEPGGGPTPVLARFLNQDWQQLAGGAAQSAAQDGPRNPLAEAMGGAQGAAPGNVGGSLLAGVAGVASAVGGAQGGLPGAAAAATQSIAQGVGGLLGALAPGDVLGAALGSGAQPFKEDLNAEVDRRFYAETGYPEGKKLDPKRPEDAPFIQSWLKIRNEVRAERQAAAQGAGAAAGHGVAQGAAQGAAAGAGAAAGQTVAQGAAAGAAGAAGAAAGGAVAQGAAQGAAGAAGAAAGQGVAQGAEQAAGTAAGQAEGSAAGGGTATAQQGTAQGTGPAGGAAGRQPQLPPQLQPDRTPAAQPPPQPQSAQNPASGINWEEIFSPMNVARGVFEVGRLVPVYGLASGLIADGLQHVADLQSLEGVEVPAWMETLITIRNAVNIINNAIGHVLYVDELIQDGLMASVEFAPFASLTALVHEIGDGGKLAIDGIQLLLDVGITAGAEYQAMQFPPGSPQAAKWSDFSRNYAANILGDMLTTFLDILGLATGGTTQSSAMQQAARAAKPVIKALRFAKNAILPLIQSWWNIYGGNILPEGVTRSVVYGIIEGELRQMKLGYDVTDVVLEAMVQTFTQQRDDAYAVVQQLMGGRDPFTTLRDMSVQAIDQAQSQLGKVAQMEIFAGTALEKAAWIQGVCGDLIGKVDSLQVPTVQFTPPDLGEGVLADVAEGVLGVGASVANAGLELLADQIRGAVDTGKAAVKAPIEGVQGNATEIAEFMQILQRHAQQQVVDMQTWIADVGGRLSQCQNFEQVVDLAIREVMQFAGIEGEFQIEDIRQGWRDVGTMIDQAITWAQGQGRTPPPQGAQQTGPRAAPGEPPNQPGQSGQPGRAGSPQPAGSPAVPQSATP